MSMIGKTLAHYEITSQLGKGGMGEVYQAKDRKLGRDVAIKVLPDEFARDADRVARFQREAKLLASLNHPNIAAIHGLEESGGINFLVLELVEGQTLADLIKAGPIPVEESLKLALQIAEALEAAHEKGVIHRDLKPANIKVTPDGKVKVLDFGLAKAFAGDQADLNLSNSPTQTYSPTLSSAATQQGVILGTAAYMSPEQARGKSVDKRADIWAFGCLLYEMLTGCIAFRGEDVSEILASVIKGDMKLDLLPASIHPRVREVITRCLQKDLKRRYHDIADSRYEIEQALADPSGVLIQQVTTVEPRRKLGMVLPWIAAAIVLGSIITGVAVWNLRKPESRQVVRFDYNLPEGQQFSSLFNPALAVSPDGKQFAYCTTNGLFLRSMGELDARRISVGNENTSTPFFSPDGQWIGYLSLTERKLKKVAINGGVPSPLCDVATDAAFHVAGASWGADDTIVYSQFGKGIMRISADGGTPETLIPNEQLYHPRLLPDQKSVIFTFGRYPYQIAVQSIKSNKRKVLFPGENACYLPTGHIVYALENYLYAVPFDLENLQAGASAPVFEGLSRHGVNAPSQYSVSNSGALIYVPKTITTAATGRTLVWVDRNGKEELVGAAPDLYNGLKLSPDGKRVALAASIDGNEDIYVLDFGRKTPSRLTFDESVDTTPLWTHDGKRILFRTHRKDGNGRVCWKAADGTGKDEPVVGSAVPGMATLPLSWSGEKTLVLMEYAITAGMRVRAGIGALAMEGDCKYKPLLKRENSVYQPQISPDGHWVAYVSNESGQAQIYVRSFPELETGGCWQISTSGGHSPLWSRDGRELFYRIGDDIMAAAVKTKPTFSNESPKVLFQRSYLSHPVGMGESLGLYQWDISQDGKHFLMIKDAATETPHKINIVLNWFEELKQRVPVK
jgi:eukaryotic-like serine/threonine-protein kinase